MSTSTHDMNHALVLGGGMAGLLTARVLADAYDRVTIVDRDDLSTGPQPRRGTPQARHVHALLAGGQQAVEDLFPGITDDLRAAGAPVGDVLDDTRLYFSGHRLRQAPSDLTLIHVSRGLLESKVRDRVRARPDVTVLDRCDVVGLAMSLGGDRIRGARLLRRADDSAEEELAADLVVDATGRGSRLGAWLHQLGRTRPAEERLPIGVGYATRRHRLDHEALGGDLGVLHGLTPQHPRGGAIALVEDGQAVVTLAGMLGDHPPTDPEGFAAFACSLRFPDIADAIRDTEPLDDPVAYRFPAATRRRYDRLADMPARVVAVGDGVCSLNPIYGQGMTVAAQQALTLQRHLRRHGRPGHPQLQRDLVRVTDVAWSMARGADLAFPGVDGARTAGTRILGAYVIRVHAAAARDATVGRAFMRVSGMVAPPTALLRPDVVARVLWRGEGSVMTRTADDRSRVPAA